MLSLLKKKSEAAAAPTVPAWHPNFRNYEKLPDIKVVRTAFFINGVAILVALTLAIYFGFKEWQLRAINTQITQLDAQIARDKKGSDQAVALFGKFKAEEAKILEVDGFIKSKPSVSSLIIRLSETLPKNIAIDNIDLRGDQMLLRLSVRGTPDVAPGHATAYLEQLRADQQLNKQFEEFSFTSPPSINPVTGRMVVEFALKLKGVGGKK